MKRLTRLVITTLLLAGLVLPLFGGATLAQEAHRVRAVRFEGTVQSRPEGTRIGDWTISGQTVKVVEATRFIEARGPATVGAKVAVHAKKLDDGSLEALQIRVLEPAFRRTKVRGVITELGADYLVVNGLRITYNTDTVIVGTLAVGAVVKIDALVTPTSYLAVRIEVLPRVEPPFVVFEGAVESFSDTSWTVAGRTVTVNEHTIIVGAPAVGLLAKVRAWVKPDGSLLAIWIQVNAPPETVEWTGPIVFFPPRSLGMWIVGERAVLVTHDTVVTGTPLVGKEAHVVAKLWASRVPIAVTIDVIEPAPTETP